MCSVSNRPGRFKQAWAWRDTRLTKNVTSCLHSILRKVKIFLFLASQAIVLRSDTQKRHTHTIKSASTWEFLSLRRGLLLYNAREYCENNKNNHAKEKLNEACNCRQSSSVIFCILSVVLHSIYNFHDFPFVSIVLYKSFIRGGLYNQTYAAICTRRATRRFVKLFVFHTNALKTYDIFRQG